MVKKILVAFGVVIIIALGIMGGMRYMAYKKWEHLYQHAFQLLEEQIAYYITDHYSGVSKVEFSPILTSGGDGTTFFGADVVPVVYDNYGNKAYLGQEVKTTLFSSFGTLSGIWAIDLDYEGKEIIYLSSDEGEMDVSEYEHLPEKARMKKYGAIDENIEMLVEDEQLVGVTKNDQGSPQAEIVYNLKIEKGDAATWR